MLPHLGVHNTSYAHMNPTVTYVTYSLGFEIVSTHLYKNFSFQTATHFNSPIVLAILCCL